MHVGLGERDAAFEWLDRAYALRDPRMLNLRLQELFDPYNSDPRFIALEVNTWKGQALEDTEDCSTNKFTTFGFANSDVDGIYDELAALTADDAEKKHDPEGEDPERE